MSGPMDRAKIETLVALWRAKCPAASGEAYHVVRLERASWDLNSRDFSAFGASCGLRDEGALPPIAIVVAPEARETLGWFRIYAEQRARQGRVCGAFTDPERALEWVRARARALARVAT
jgi:hypothetical protein